MTSIPYKLHVILLSETWLKTDEQALEMHLQNYTHYFCNRTDKTGGGVSAYVHNDLQHTLINSTYEDGNNYLWFRLDKYALDVGVVYYPGDTNYQHFLDTFDSQIQTKSRAIVFGDFNINLLKSEIILMKSFVPERRLPLNQ